MVKLISSNGGSKGASLLSNHSYQKHQPEPGTSRDGLVPTQVDVIHMNALISILPQKKRQNFTVSVNDVLRKTISVEKEDTNLQAFSMH